ncbi:MAG: DUF2318 domain-containing protein [Thermoleophilia bacterium]|nr:DUF2318 domain-containing protein [Thermoleophilia bacterium]
MSQFAHDSDALAEKRQRFEEAGKFPVRKVALIGVAVAVLLFGGFYGYVRWQESRQVGGVVVMPDVRYPAAQVEMVTLDSATQTADGIAIPLADLEKDYIVGFTYARTNPMPEGYQLAAGGNVLPLMAYIAPTGRLVVATSFCEPCRSTTFHFEDKQLVCDVCFTRWDLSTLIGIGGGCFDYPPEEVAAEVRGDRVFVPQADLEAWVPRAYQDASAVDPTMSTLPPAGQ